MGDDAAASPSPNEPVDAARIREHKCALRRALRTTRRERRDATTAAQRIADGEALVSNTRPVLEGVRCVATFEPLSTESNLDPLNAHLLAAAHVERVLVPVTLDDLDLSWRDLATGADLGPGAIVEADLVIAPALAIGRAGERLGQGGGCYDKALPRRRRGVPVIAVVFPEEFGLDLPLEAHDERVDAVLTVDALTPITTALKY